MAEGCETAKHDSVQPDFVCFSTSCLPCRRKNLKLLRANGAHLSADSLRTGQLRERFVTCSGNRDPLEICHILSIWMFENGVYHGIPSMMAILRGKMDDKPVDYRGTRIFRHMFLHDSATTHDAARSRKHRLTAFEDSGHIFCDQCGKAW